MNKTLEGGFKITRITPVEAQNYISEKEDETNAPVKFFTITPNEELGDGWETVTYYTNRIKNFRAPKGLQGCQYIYVLTNDLMPGICKIGFTKETPNKRVKQINSATGVAMDFDVRYSFPCFNAHDLEGEIHKYLEKEGFRVNRRKEFFSITVEDAVSVIERIGEPYRMEEVE